MPQLQNSHGHLRFGTCKYASLHLMLARWLYRARCGPDWRYVTLGGTELRDIESLSYVSSNSFHEAISYEIERQSYELASTKAAELRRSGLNVTVKRGDIFSFRRNDSRSNVFFVDLCGICAFADYEVRFRNLFAEETLSTGDAVIITSSMNRHPGWPIIFERYQSVFRILRTTDADEKKALYDSAHPTFTLYNALTAAGLINTLRLECIGMVSYHDTSKMGLFGYIIGSGITRLSTMINETPRFSLTKNRFTSLDRIRVH